MFKKCRKHNKELTNWMSWMMKFNIKLMVIHFKINNLLSDMKKVGLTMMTPTEELMYQNTQRVTY